MREMAQLYSEALQNTALKQTLEMRVQAMAARENQSEPDLYREIEALAASQPAQKEIREEREARKEKERSQVYVSLEPFLDLIGREHSKIIMSELLLPGLVNPLITGEVEFRFRGEHKFLVGDELFFGENEGKTKESSFKSGDDFAIGQVPVTQLMYFLAALIAKDGNPTPSMFKEGHGGVILKLGDKTYSLKPNHPVEKVSYADAEAHAARVSAFIGARYGLPDEVQWEFASRAGSSTNYYFGDDARELPSYAWFNQNSADQTHEVGQLFPNKFHLFDTLGNVNECTASTHNAERITRGGGYFTGARDARSARRSHITSTHRYGDYGFRLVRRTAGNSSPSHIITLGESDPEGTPALEQRGGPR
jgi:hypothetical protein